jgi:hypothetical protein
MSDRPVTPAFGILVFGEAASFRLAIGLALVVCGLSLIAV